jgi:predicted nucleotidyltransferase
MERTLEAADLDADERRLLAAFADALSREFGPDLHGLWLFGSRARGQRSGPESDVDLLVIVEGATGGTQDRVSQLLHDAGTRVGQAGLAFFFAPIVVTPEWIDGRRAIDAFFIQDVDRDRITVA